MFIEKRKAKVFLELVKPHIEEEWIDVVRGIGWGPKTLLRCSPDILVQLLEKQFKDERKISKMMRRKATTYLKPF